MPSFLFCCPTTKQSLCTFGTQVRAKLCTGLAMAPVETCTRFLQTHAHTHTHTGSKMGRVDVFEQRLSPDTKLISRLEDANDWPTRNQQHQARTHIPPWTDGLQDHTSTCIPLSHSVSLWLYLCHPPHQNLILSQSVFF